MDKSQSPGGAERLQELQMQHHALEQRLAELDAHLSLTPEEQVERSRIKKLKLAMKDEIARLGRQRPPATG